MSSIKIPLHFEGSLGERTGYAHFDSIVSFYGLNPDFLEQLEVPVKMRKPLEIATANQGSYLKISHAVRFGFLLQRHSPFG